MSNMNQCNFIGRLVKDPDLRYTPGGDAVCTASIAVSEKWDGKESTYFPVLVFWKRTAEILAEYAKKGDRIRVTGKYRNRKYDDKEGQTRYAHEFTVREMELIETRADRNDHAQSRAAPVQQPPEDFDDDIPF